MHSFVDLDRTFAGQPRELGVVLARIDTGRGREQLFESRAPDVLRHLSENARVASITASNAIEGVVVESERGIKIADGAARFRNRNEKEFAGYRDVLDGLMREPASEALSVPLVLHLHRLLFAHAGGRGGHLKADENFIVSYEGGERNVVFAPPTPHEAEFLLPDLLARYDAAQRAQLAHPLVLVGALILDFLAIHPVADGNGRLARLLTTRELLAQGYGVVRYVSLEQLIFESKNSYYEALFDSQQGWHTAEHTVWPWITYLVSVLADAYDDFELRVGNARATSGSKQDRVRDHILHDATPPFSRRDIERALPGVSVATIRIVLGELRDEQRIAVEGRGPGARWHRVEPQPPEQRRPRRRADR